MKKRIGIIVDSTNVDKQLADLISLSKKSSNYEIIALIINNIKHKNKNLLLQIVDYIKRRGLQKLISNTVFKILCKIESIILKRKINLINFIIDTN